MPDTHVVEMNEQGRIVIPAPLRKQLGFTPGVQLVARIENGALVLMPQDVIKARLWAMFEGLDRSMARDLIRDRAREAKLENKK